MVRQSSSPVVEVHSRPGLSDQRTWEAIAEAVIQPAEDDVCAHVEFVDDGDDRGLALEPPLGLLPDGDMCAFFMVVRHHRPRIRQSRVVDQLREAAIPYQVGGRR